MVAAHRATHTEAGTPIDRNDVTSQIVLLSGARIAAACLSAVTALMLVHQLSKSDYGQLSLLTGIVGLIVVLSDAGLTSSTARFLSENRARRGLLLRVMAVRATVAGLVVVAVLGYAATGRLQNMGPAVMLATALLLANSTVSLAQGLLPALRRIRIAAVLTLMVPMVELTGIVIAVRAGLTAPTALIAMSVAAGAGAALSLIVLLTQPLSTTDSVALPEVVRYAVPLFGVLLCDSIFGVIDQILIAVFHGAAAVAPYALSWKLVMFLHLPAVAIAVVVSPRLVRDRGDAPELFARWFRRTAVLNIGVLAVAAALASDLMGLINEQYRQDGPVLQALTVYAAVLGVAPLLSIACNYLGGAHGRLRIAAVAVAVNVALDLALIPAWGAFGAAVSSTVAYLIYVGGHARLLKNLLDTPIWTGGYALAARITVAAIAAVAVARIANQHLGSAGVLTPVVAGLLALAAYLAVVGTGALK